MNEYWGQYWGEMSATTDIGSGIVAIERTDLSKVEPICLRTDKTDYRFGESEDKSVDNSVVSDVPIGSPVVSDVPIGSPVVVSDVPIGSPVVLHSIKLLQFLRQLNDNTITTDLSRDSVPQLIQTNDKQLNANNISKRHFNSKAVKELIRRSVVIISVFYGFEYMTQSAIDLLVDILSEYLTRFCQTLRTTTDSLELMSSNDFIDVIDRVFHDMNVSNFESLRQYDSDIRLYNQNLMKEVLRKIGISESKITSDFPIVLDTNSDNLVQMSSNSQTEAKEEPNLSLKSLLSSYKSDEIHENEQLFGLTSPSNGTDS